MIGALRAARRDTSLAVLEGFHAVKHAVRFGAVLERVVAVDGTEVAALCARLAPDVEAALAAVVEEVPPEVFAQLAPRPVPTGVVAIARRPAERALGTEAPAVLLDDPRHLANVGACVRVAAAAGAAGVIVCGDVDPWAPEALRGSAGLHFALPVLRGDGAPDGRPLVAFDPDGAPVDPRALPQDAVLAFGSERDGLSARVKDQADAVVALPMQPGVSSLNLATSVSAALYAWRLSGA